MQDRYRLQYQLHGRLRSFRRRVDQGKRHIEHFLRCCDAPYLAFSGGKDSLCLLILCQQMGLADLPVFTQLNDHSWPDMPGWTREAVQSLGFMDYSQCWSAVSALEQLAQFDWQSDEDLTVRGTLTHVIQRYVRERERTGALLGLRAEESRSRRYTRWRHGHSYQRQDGIWHGCPLFDWSGEDVFALILTTQTPYFHVYDADDCCPPHEIRMAGILGTNHTNYGAAVWLKRHYPDEYRRLLALSPGLSTVT